MCQNGWVNLHFTACRDVGLKPGLKANYYAPTVGKGGNKRWFCPSVCLSVSPSVAHIANSSKTQKPSVPKFERKVPHLICDSHTSFKIKRSKVGVRGGRGHTVSAEPDGHTACLDLALVSKVVTFALTLSWGQSQVYDQIYSHLKQEYLHCHKKLVRLLFDCGVISQVSSRRRAMMSCDTIKLINY